MPETIKHPDGTHRVTIQVLISRMINNREKFLGGDLHVIHFPPEAPDASIAAECTKTYNELSAKVLGKIEEKKIDPQKQPPTTKP